MPRDSLVPSRMRSALGKGGGECSNEASAGRKVRAREPRVSRIWALAWSDGRAGQTGENRSRSVAFWGILGLFSQASKIRSETSIKTKQLVSRTSECSGGGRRLWLGQPGHLVGSPGRAGGGAERDARGSGQREGCARTFRCPHTVRGNAMRLSHCSSYLSTAYTIGTWEARGAGQDARRPGSVVAALRSEWRWRPL